MALFRDQAIDYQRRRFQGRAVLVRPVPLTVMTALMLTILGAIGSFLALADYARSESVPGYLAPAAGAVKVYPPRPGVVSRLAVAEGESVTAGQPLFDIRSEQSLGGGQGLDTAVLASLDEQLRAIDRRIAEAGQRLAVQRERFASAIAGYEAELTALTRQRAAQAELVTLAERALEAGRSLAAQGHLPRALLAERESAYWQAERELAGLGARIGSLEERIEQTRLDIREAEMDTAERVAGLRRSRAELARSRLEVAGRRSVTVEAPRDGIVTALQLGDGAQANPQRPALVILPARTALEARLLIPTRAAGMVRNGQAVRLFYDAFPHQRFGTHAGEITQIARSILAPAEIGAPVAPQEPVYEARARLTAQTVKAYGQAMPLQAGMTLRADIVLERQSLLDWILDPVRSLRGRV